MPRYKEELSEEQIQLKKEKTKQYHKQYYEKHAEAIKARCRECNKIRYYAKKENEKEK